MFTSKHFANLFSSSIIGGVSLIFVYKYSLVYFNRPELSALVYSLLFFFVLVSFDKIKTVPGWNKNNSYFIAAILIFFLLLLYCIFFTPKVSNSFGLLAIKNWLNNLFNGTFPYSMKNTFAGYPFFYLVLSPFYLIGNIALLEVFLWVILALFLIFHSVTVREKVIKLFFLLVSPLTFFGLFEASGYFLSAAIIIVIILLSNKYLNPAKVDRYFILFAVALGLFFSISIEVITVLIIYLLYFFRNHMKELSLFLEILLAVFLITIIPFIVWNPILFFINGPISSFLNFKFPWWETILFLGVAFYIGWMVSDLQEIFFSTGILLIITSVINLFLLHTSLSSFIFALPFLIFSIKDYRVEKYSGKVLID